MCYEAVNAMLLSEFFKEHGKVVATVKEQAAQIQKVSASFRLATAASNFSEVSKPAP